MSTSEKSILITGCSSGIGLHCALGLQQRGYRVFASARKPEDVQVLAEQGLEALVLDLNDSDSITAAVNQLLAKTNGQLFALFNNGAYGQPGAVEDLSRNVLRENFETNLFGTHELTCKILPIMRRQGYGRIIQNSSVLGFIGLPYRGAYNASKYALEGLTDTLRNELYDTNITISIIQPGPIKSKFRANAFAKYQQNIDTENSAHREKYVKIAARLTKEGQSTPWTLGPDAILEKLIHALESPRPKVRYYVTKPTYLFAFLRRVLPYRLMDKVLLKVSREEHT